MSVSKRKDCKNTYQVIWREPGSGKIRREHFSGPNAKKDAEIYDREIKLQKAKDPAVLLADQEESPSLGKIISLYITYTKPYKSETSVRMELYHVKEIVRLVGNVPVDSLETSHIQSAKRDHMEREISMSTFRRRWDIIRSALNWAVNEGYISSNPLAGYRVKKPSKEPILPPSPEELQALLKHSSEHLRRAIILAYYTGARPGPSELFGLQWRTVDLKGGWIQILSANKGNQVWREIPIHEDLAEQLARWREEDSRTGISWVIHYRGRPVKSVRSSWREAKRKAGIERKLRPYDLRHAFITSALDAGADVQAVSDMAGHSDMKTTLEHYRHIKSEVKRSSIDRLPKLSIDVIQNRDTKAE